MKLPNGLHPRAYVSAYKYLVPLSNLIRAMDGPEHVRELCDRTPRISIGNRLFITYSVQGCCYRISGKANCSRYSWELVEYYFDTPIEVLMALPYILYSDQDY